MRPSDWFVTSEDHIIRKTVLNIRSDYEYRPYI